MTKRDYVSAPLSESLGLTGVIAGLVSDLDALRAGKISVNDAVARSLLAKQIFNGVRIYMNGTKMLSDAAVLPADHGASDGTGRDPSPPVIDDESSRDTLNSKTPRTEDRSRG